MLLTRRLALIVLASSLALTGGCSHAGKKAPDAASLLATAKAKLDATGAVHFVLSSTDVPPGAGPLLGGEGDAVRPDRFAGVLEIVVLGTQAKVSVVSIAGKVYVKLPFASSFISADPKQFGIPDPGTFMSPTSGVTQLLAAATGATLAGEARVGSAVTRQVMAKLPGDVVGKVLVTADPATPVDATFDIDEATGQLVQARLIGPFFAKGFKSTYTLILSKYGEQVDIHAPTT